MRCSLSQGFCCVIVALVLGWMAPGSAYGKDVSVAGSVSPPRAQAGPLKTNWNVRIQAIDPNGNAVRSWNVTADNAGKFACNLGSVRAARVRVTVLGGWAYYDSLKEHSSPLVRRSIVSHHTMRRK